MSKEERIEIRGTQLRLATEKLTEAVDTQVMNERLVLFLAEQMLHDLVLTSQISIEA